MEPSSKPVSIVLAGIGGYGGFYLNILLDETDPATYRIVGVVDQSPERCGRLDELKARNIPVYPALEDFYTRHEAELAILSTPIHFHCPHICCALSHGSNVLCEKPVCATIQEARRIIETRDQTGRFVAIGYQWSFNDAIQKLKQDIISGLYGKPLRLKTVALQPRPFSYYDRNNWAGALDDGNANWILDSPINNATAHFLQNMFYVLGDRVDRSARPARVTAELYRAHDITNFDTGAVRIFTEEGVEMLHIASHVTDQRLSLEFLYEFERGSVHYNDERRAIYARFPNGKEKIYGNPFDNLENKLRDSIAAVRGRTRIVCGPEAATSMTLAVNGIQESMPRIIDFPKNLLKRKNENDREFLFVENLDNYLIQCYRERTLPSELDIPWARSGHEIDLTSYDTFPSAAFVAARESAR